MTTYAHRAAVVDRLLDEWGVPPKDVIAINIYATDVLVYVRDPLEKFEWRSTVQGGGVSYRHETVREDLPIIVIAWVPVAQGVAA